MIPDHILFDHAYVDWAPLHNVIPEDEYGDWMWMHAVDGADGERVHFYKHIMTRRYLRLDRFGRVYTEDCSGRPQPVALSPAERRAVLEAAKLM